MRRCEQKWDLSSCAVIVAHPDDETLWAGGTILMHPQSVWTVITLCRKSDTDRATRFYRALEKLNATGAMGDLDDSAEQIPLDEREVEGTILRLLTADRFDLIMTHGLCGEYTRHLRHEETARTVVALVNNGKLSAGELWMFAYEDGGGKYLPKADCSADVQLELPQEIWQKKYGIITDVYGFGLDSFEARTTPRAEAFSRRVIGNRQ